MTTPREYWAVAQVITGREHVVRSEIENSNYGAFLATYGQSGVRRGLRFARERPLLPGYVLFHTGPESWGGVAAIDGLIRVVNSQGKASPVQDSEMIRLVLGHAGGAHNEIAHASSAAPRTRRRKPRPGKRLRKVTS
ncbi:transcription antitermination factor NusG [Bradyrhizobium diazoefficiens]|uniref:transcription termination/antitermination NusG family protein n=1 Tax=Bradyrhizobium TaxID=374 RepID=UPI003183E122